jgi:hypothetical protein
MSTSRRCAAVLAVLAAAGAVTAHARGTVARTAAGLPAGGEQVALDPADFTTRIDNPYWPMRTGSRWVYRATDQEGSRSRSVVTATGRTKVMANGVRAAALRDAVSEEGELVEVAVEWYAQDGAGNVWYLGEDVEEYEGGRLVGTESWEAGAGGARPGVVMPGRPRRGLRFRENHIPGNPGDRFEILSVREQAGTAFRHFDRALLIKQTTPERRTALEYVFHAPGVGLVLTLEIAGGSDRLELVRYRAGRAPAR